MQFSGTELHVQPVHKLQAALLDPIDAKFALEKDLKEPQALIV